MNLRARTAGWLCPATVMIFAAFVVAGFVVAAPSVAEAAVGTTVTPMLSVSPSAGSVGSIVTVSFGPANDGCGSPVFEPVTGSSAGQQILPYIGPAGGVEGSSGSQDFVIPSVLSSPSAHINAAVAPGSYEFVLVCDTTNEPATAKTVSVPFAVTAAQPGRFVGAASTANGGGYWLAQACGGVFSFGDAQFYGSLPGQGVVPAGQIVGIAATPDGGGYWMVGDDGGVFSFGDAQYYGNSVGVVSGTGGAPTVGMAATPDGKGYWLVSANGAVGAFGDAPSYGSAASLHLYAPIVGMAATPDGKGYWLVASDGGVFSFGDAQFYGSMGGQHLNQPIVAMTVDPTTGGYWEVAADGGVFSFDAPFLGSTGSIHLNDPITGIARTSTGLGYRLEASDGGVFDFGDTQFYGSGA